MMVSSAYLDLRVTKEANGGLVSESPEVLVRKVQRIIELDCWVGLCGDGFKVSLGSIKGTLGRRRGRRCEGSGASEKRGKDQGELHCQVCGSN